MSTAEFKIITPEIAQAMLVGNTINRPINPSHVDTIARDMKAGRYQMNGDPIRFDTDGTLLDGQHRLSAIVASGTYHNMLLVRGLPRESIKTIDSGMKRTNGQRLTMEGVKYANSVSAALNVMCCVAKNTPRGGLTSNELFSVYSAHPGIVESVRISVKSAVMPASFLSALHYIGCYTGYKEEADAFVETMISGIPAQNNDPAIALRERLIRAHTASRSIQRGLLMETMAAAWEAKRTHRETKVIKTKKERNLEFHGWNEHELFNGKVEDVAS